MNDVEMNANDDIVRQRAEKLAAQMPEDLTELSPEAGRQLLHELRVHQIELEMQNEELRQTQLALEAARARYFDLYDLAPVGYITLNDKGIILEANLTLVDLLGVARKTVVQRPLTRFIYPPDQDTFYQRRRQLFTTGAPQVCELRLLRANGNPFWAQLEAAIKLEDGASQPTCRIIISDIAMRKQAALALHESHHRLQLAIDQLRETQARLVQQERLAAIGQLAAGIAHDFNNILAIITLYTGMSLGLPDLSPKLDKNLEIVRLQTKHAADLVQQILDFGRRAMLQTESLDLTSLLREQVKLWQRAISESITIHFDVEAADCLVDADRTRLQQLFTNLVLNARDAMPDGGDLRFILAQLHLKRGDAPPLPDMPVGKWVRVTVSDSGIGIDSATLPYIFEPFFTNKEPGQGSGLGLAQVYGIVKQHNGYVDVQTAPDRGTTFTIYLPLLVAPLPKVAAAASPTLVQGHGETILLAEDNDVLREGLAAILTMLNYRVLTAANGSEALTLLDQDAAGDLPEKPIALVLSDLVMPEMGGKALLQAMHQRGLTMPFLILSGHPREVEQQSRQMQAFAGWLLKPIGAEELATAVARALSGD